MTYPRIGEAYTPRPDDTLVAEADNKCNILVYRHSNGFYTVVNENLARHVNINAEGVIRALAWYLQGGL